MRGSSLIPTVWYMEFTESAQDNMSRTNLSVKVLDFFQLGGPKLTVGSTIFEMWLGLGAPAAP